MPAAVWHDQGMPEPSRRIPYRTWPGALAVLLAIAAYVGGLTFWDSRTPGSRPLAAGQTTGRWCGSKDSWSAANA